ncbi:hypothetical protein E2I00_001787, partial [Balaenoptera physalus]
VNAGHATPGFSVSYWQRSSQEADKPPFALWAAWAKGLPAVLAKRLTRLLLPFLLTGHRGHSEDRKVAPRTQAGGDPGIPEDHSPRVGAPCYTEPRTGVDPAPSSRCSNRPPLSTQPPAGLPKQHLAGYQTLPLSREGQTGDQAVLPSAPRAPAPETLLISLFADLPLATTLFPQPDALWIKGGKSSYRP